MLTLDPAIEQSLREILQNIPFDKVYEIIKYHPNYVEPRFSHVHPDDYDFFAIVADGEVAEVFPANKQQMSRFIAAMSSNPKVVVLTNEQKNVVQTGWTYNQETGAFTEPVE